MAQANALALRGTLFPVVTGSFDASRQKTSQTLTSDVSSGASIFSLHTAQVSVSYVLDMWGGTQRQIDAADAQGETQAFRREGIYLTLTSNIALAAIEEARLRGQIRATLRIIDLQLELLANLQRRHDEGLIALPEVTTQETAVARARLLLAPL